ncbi:MAG: serine hydrolase [Bacteroidetes bacterium]|nr:serine hydrolase [Bacteroidota bacterium]
MKVYLTCLLLMLSVIASAQEMDTVFLKNLLESHRDLFEHVLNHPTHNEVQILYTQIDRDENNMPHFRSYSYRLNANHYFYPASTVKLPTAIFALEKMNEINMKGLVMQQRRLTRKEMDKFIEKGLNINSTMITDSAFGGQTKVTHDSTAKNGLPSIGNYIKKILLVSDNDAYNRLYEFVGREEINQKLKKYNLNGTRIIGRLAIGDKGESTRHTNPIRFYNGDKLVYEKPALYDPNEYPMHPEHMVMGKGYLDSHDKLVMEPFDFSHNNIYPLADQQMVLKRLLFPETFPKEQQYNLTDEQYKLIYKYMSMWPTESRYPTYSPPAYYPAYCKWLFYGGDSLAVIKPHIRIFDKIGDSYGYDIDNAYIVDFQNKVEFMLSAVVQSNDDDIYNDNKYEYKTVCLPFMKNLAQVIYQYELKREKKYLPDLKKFKFRY